MKCRLSALDIPSGSSPQSYTARLFDEAIGQMIKQGIPLSDYDKFMEAQDRKAEEEERKLAAKKTKASKVKPGSKTKKPKKTPSKKKLSGS